MNCWVLLCIFVGYVLCQQTDEEIGERLGLLGTSLGLDPLGNIPAGKNTDNEEDMSAPLISLDDPFENIPDEMNNMNDDEDIATNEQAVSIENFKDKNNESSSNVFGFVSNPVGVESDKLTEGIPPNPPPSSPQCCCIPSTDICPDPLGGTDLVSSGLIDDRLEQQQQSKPVDNSAITFRISPEELPAAPTCPLAMKACCYQPDLDLQTFDISCLTPEQAHTPEQWKQSCEETPEQGVVKQCGTRSFLRPAEGLHDNEASPGEFPWTCMILTRGNGFVGNCAIIPGNNGTTKSVITAAHKLNKISDSRELKVRVGEYDARGFRHPEAINYQEYSVNATIKHPQFSPKRLSHDLALLVLTEDIDLSQPNVNTACLPSCQDQFSYQFPNGTGTSCWVAGWGTNHTTGSFKPVQHKLNLPLVEAARCEANLSQALNAQSEGVGDQFVLSTSEVCAGGDQQDACTGDGGSPLVCQALSGRWTVVGLVTWGVGCGGEVPGVYVDIAQARDWIVNVRDTNID